jgi:hypothetical protein
VRPIAKNNLDTIDTNPIVLEDIDPSLEWILESQSTLFVGDDSCWVHWKPLVAPNIPRTSDASRGLRQENEAMNVDECRSRG